MLFLSLRPTLFLVQSRSLSSRHVSTSFLDPVLGAMMKQVCWHSRRFMAASRLLRMCWSSRGLPRLPLALFTTSSESEKMPIEEYIWLPPIFFCSNALIALARSLCKCLLAVLTIASGADTVKGYLVRCACIDDTIPWQEKNQQPTKQNKNTPTRPKQATRNPKPQKQKTGNHNWNGMSNGGNET